MYRLDLVKLILLLHDHKFIGCVCQLILVLKFDITRLIIFFKLVEK